MSFKLASILGLLALFTLFIIQNIAPVDVQFLFWSMQMPRSLLIILLLSSGALVGWFLHSFLELRKDHDDHQQTL